MKKAIIEVKLVDEAGEVENQQIEKEIGEELSNAVVPWVREVLKVTVLET